MDAIIPDEQESTDLPLTRHDPNYHEPTAPDLARTRPRLAIVVPCFNEELVIGETVRRLAAVLGDLREKGQVAPGIYEYRRPLEGKAIAPLPKWEEPAERSES